MKITAILAFSFAAAAGPVAAFPLMDPAGEDLVIRGTLSHPVEETVKIATRSAVNPATVPFGGTFLHGVNIGNWLVLEKWMDNGTVFSGSFASASDQWTFDSISGSEGALQNHWNTWFTETDMKRLKGYGFNAVRIPIGFWAFDNKDTPYHTGGADYLDQAIVWARRAGMKVLVDLHGSPGSQNGKDHSGHAGAIEWQENENLNRSTAVIQTMVAKYGTKQYSDVVFGIEIVNEPQAGSPNSFKMSKQWAVDAWTAARETIRTNRLNENLQIITHDSFMGPEQFIPVAQALVASRAPGINGALGDDLNGTASGSSGSDDEDEEKKHNEKKKKKNKSKGKKNNGGKTGGKKAKRAALVDTTFGVDQHNYQLYTDADKALTQQQHIEKACGWGADLATTKAVMPVYVGEFSALTHVCIDDGGNDCASGSSSSCSCTSAPSSKWSQALVDAVRKFVEAQLDTFEQNSDGYFLWSYGGPGGWGLDNLAKIGAWPSPLDERKFPNQCGGS